MRKPRDRALGRWLLSYYVVAVGASLAKGCAEHGVPDGDGPRLVVLAVVLLWSAAVAAAVSGRTP